MNEDIELLRRYASAQSEEAFRELVQRRVGLVFSIALRKTRDVQRAEDASQIVFTSLARHAGALAKRDVLIGWFYHAAHNAATDIIRAEISRGVREREAQAMQEIFAPSVPVTDWDQVRPILDDALNELEGDERDAVLMRFFEGCKYPEIGRSLHVPENTARMCVERALDKLHGLLARRGIASTSAALATVLTQQAATAVPSGLVSSIMQAALPAAAVVTGIQATLLKTLFTPKTIGVGAAMVIGLSIAVINSRKPVPAAITPTPTLALANGVLAQGAPAPTAAATAPVTPKSLGNERSPNAAPPATAAVPLAPPAPDNPLTSQQQSAVRNNLMMIQAARDYFLKKYDRLPDSLSDIVGANGPIRVLKPVIEEDYSSVKLDAKILAVQMPNGFAVTLSTDGPVRRGPPSMAESQEWNRALATYVQMRPAGREPRLPVKASDANSIPKGLKFVGVMASGNGPVFVLADESGISQWLKLGQQFGPYLLKEYRAEAEILVLIANDLPLELKLTNAKVDSSFTAETEIAYLALQEVMAREGWTFANVSIQKPDFMPAQENLRVPAHWVDFIHQILERDTNHIVMGDNVVVEFDVNGKFTAYKNLGPRKPAAK